jgi:hypothetical protein
MNCTPIRKILLAVRVRRPSSPSPPIGWTMTLLVHLSALAITLTFGATVSVAANDEQPDQSRNVKDRTVVCTLQYNPVCGMVDGKPKNYSNRCFAKADGASNIKDGQCP